VFNSKTLSLASVTLLKRKTARASSHEKQRKKNTHNINTYITMRRSALSSLLSLRVVRRQQQQLQHHLEEASCSKYASAFLQRPLGAGKNNFFSSSSSSSASTTTTTENDNDDESNDGGDDPRVASFFAAVARKHKGEVDAEKWLEHFPDMEQLESRMNGQLGKKLGMSVKERKRVMQYLSKYKVGLFKLPSSSASSS
jgi:hypothetical protein